MSPTDDDAPLDPRAMLDIIEGEKREQARRDRRQVPSFYLVWGVAWLAGFLVVWSAAPGSPSPLEIPAAVAWIVFFVLMAGAAVTSAVVGIRMNAGIRGRSQWVGMIYGWSWTILGGAVAAVGVAMIRAGLPPELASLYFPSAYAVVVAALYLAGAMLWESLDQLVIAIVIAVAGAVAPFFGAPANYLVMAVLGGGPMLVGGVLAALRNRRL